MSGFALGVSWGGAGGEIAQPVIAAVAEAFSPWPRPAEQRLGSAVYLAESRSIGEVIPGESWTVTDARLDKGTNRAGREAAPASRIARLWRGNGEEALPMLQGEFALAVWDRRNRRLVAARDAFGVRPLYFFESPGGVWISNLPGALLAAARAFRSASVQGLQLDDLGVSDRLLFGRCLEPEATVYKSLRRIAPGSLRWWQPSGRGGSKWHQFRARDLPRKMAEGEVVTELRSALDFAVRDRLPDDRRVCLWMSGGLDSTSVASSCAAVGARAIAHTVTYERLIVDSEGEMAALAAKHLGLEHRRHVVDDYRLFERWNELPAAPLPAEPEFDAMYVDIDRDAILHSPVALTGFGADPLLLPERDGLWRDIFSAQAIRGLLGWWRAYRQVGVRPPLGIASRLAHRRSSRERWPLPRWLAPDLAARIGAEQRWRLLNPKPHRFRGERRREALNHTFDPGWGHLFEQLDAGVRGIAIERRHPFFDRRLVELLLGLSALPWCLDKWALRISQRGRLPDRVRQRPKTPLAGDPWPGTFSRLDHLWSIFRSSAPDLEAFLDMAHIEKVLRSEKSERRRWHLLGPALSFACWRCRSMLG